MQMKKLYILGLLLTCSTVLNAQFLDSLQVQAGTAVTVAGKDYLPLWLIANRFGVISDQQFDFSTHLKATNAHQFGKIAVDYGLDLYNNDHLRKFILQEGYARAKYRNMTLAAGRFKQVIGEIDPELSSGSLGVSGNALPIPKISFMVDYTNVPFTNGWIQFKGQISHGWMGNDQFMKHAYLHEKNFYLRVGKRKFKLYGGIQHYAVWGGSREDFLTADRSLAGFFNVLLVKEANDGTVFGSIAPNRAGDHRGVLEAGAEWENDDLKINLNNQTPFDMGQGIDARNIDRLLSLNIINKKPGAKLKKVVLEFIYTKQMNDFYAQRYRESYYNNGIYRTGWEYNDNIIGTPLFVNRVRGSNYFNSIKPYDWDAPANTINSLDNIISNRVIGGHAAFLYALSREVTSKTMLTYTRNYGDFRVGVFSPYKSQWYSMQQFSWSVPKTQLALTGTVAYDWGQLSDNFGSMIGINWQLRK
jgi:hypothetical protein